MTATHSLDRQGRGRNALASLFGAALSLWFLNAAYTAPAAFILRAVLFLSGSTLLSSSVHRTLRHRLGPQDFWDGISEVLADDVVATGILLLKAGDRATAPLDRIVYDRLPAPIQRSLPPASVDDTGWFEQVSFWRDSKFIFGRKGTGKSVLMAYESWVIKSTDPTALLYVLDPHLDAESLWFGGNPELIKAHCYKSMQDFVRVFDLVAAELEDRKAEGDRKRPLCKIIADEWESIINGFASLPARFPQGDDRHDEAVRLSAYADKIPAIAAFIQDEGQKFQVECTIGAHGGKTKRSGIDSDILLQMHWIACDDALTMPNTPLLQVVKGEAQKLEADRRRLLPYAGEFQKFAGTAILRCVKSRSKTEPCLKAVGLPWINFEGAEVIAVEAEPTAEADTIPQLNDEEVWMEQNRDRLVAAYRSGNLSWNGLCRQFEVSKASRKGELLKEFIQQMRAIDDAEDLDDGEISP